MGFSGFACRMDIHLVMWVYTIIYIHVVVNVYNTPLIIVMLVGYSKPLTWNSSCLMTGCIDEHDGSKLTHVAAFHQSGCCGGRDSS